MDKSKSPFFTRKFVRDSSSGLYLPLNQEAKANRVPSRRASLLDIAALLIQLTTVILLCFTVFYTKRQWEESNRSANAAETSATAARSAAETASGTLSEMRWGSTASDTHNFAEQSKKQAAATRLLANTAASEAETTKQMQSDTVLMQRAFIFPELHAVMRNSPPPFPILQLAVSVIWKNTGLTPTQQLQIETEYLDVYGITTKHSAKHPSTFTFVPPNGTMSIQLETLSTTQLADISEGKLQHTIRGEARYKDIFRSDYVHLTRFCFQLKNANPRNEDDIKHFDGIFFP